ncbi:MAG TPA: hypothetical protein PLI31_05430 [Methanoregulaceae archaeon]|nr:hypothetical protein [Methanoregulaceae archaeon]
MSTITLVHRGYTFTSITCSPLPISRYAPGRLPDRIGVGVSRALALANRPVVGLSHLAGQVHEGVGVVGPGADGIARTVKYVPGDPDESENGIGKVLQSTDDLIRTVGAVSHRVCRASHRGGERPGETGIGDTPKAEAGMSIITGASSRVDAIRLSRAPARADGPGH